MEKETYFRIYFGDDHVSIENLSKEDIEEAIKDEIGDDEIFSEKMTSELKRGISVDWPENCECYRSIIIKGKLIIPRPVEVVTKYEID